MNDHGNNLFLAQEDLKRVDHIVYVSLKYAKTVDMMRNGLTRMISTIHYFIEHLLQVAYDKDLIEAIPKFELHKSNLLSKLISLEEFDEMMSFYKKLKELMKQPFTKHNEFRKHITMKVTYEDTGEIEDITMEVILNFYKKLQDEYQLVLRILNENFFIKEANDE